MFGLVQVKWFGFIPKRPRQSHPQPAYWGVLVHSGRFGPAKGEMLNTPAPAPIELCPAPVYLVFVHTFFDPAWFCIKPCSIVLHVLSILQKNLVVFFKLNEKFMFGSSPLAKMQALRKYCFSFLFK
jgi:hypothetical protein